MLPTDHGEAETDALPGGHLLSLLEVMQRCEEHLAALNRRLDHLFNFPDDPRNTPPDLYKPRTIPSDK